MSVTLNVLIDVRRRSTSRGCYDCILDESTKRSLDLTEITVLMFFVVQFKGLHIWRKPMKQKGPDYGKSTKTIQQFETSGCETLEMYNNMKKIFIIKLHMKQHENVINIFFRKKKKMYCSNTVKSMCHIVVSLVSGAEFRRSRNG